VDDFFLESHWTKAHRLDDSNGDEPAFLEVENVRRCNDNGRTDELPADDDDDDANGDTAAATPEELLFSACNN